MGTDRSNKVALVTGSGRRRVGNVIAHHLADRGYSIALHYFSSTAEANQSVESLREKRVAAEAFQANVAEEEDVKQMFDAIVARFGRLDVLVTTASIWTASSLEKTSADDLLKSFKVNALGTFLCARRGGLIMTDQREGGVIVTIGDWAIQRPYLDHAAYFVAKGAIPTMTRTLAIELGSRNPKVRVNCIHPGPVMFPPDTPDEERQALIDSTLTKNPNCPESIAQAVEGFIDNQFVTGVCLPVDGGRSIYASESTERQRPI